MFDFFLAPELGATTSLILITISAATSFMTTALGIGGGIVLLAVMAVLMPAHALIPVHGLVQLGSNGGRALITLPNVEKSVLLPFFFGSLIGASIGGLTAVQLSPMILKTGLGCFILWSVWGPSFSARGRYVVTLTGIFSSFLTMFFGATGTFISAMVKTLNLGRIEHVATHAACMVIQHTIKIIAFGLLGFAFGPYLGFIIAMIVSGFVGTVIGRSFLVRLNDQTFHKMLSVLLSLLALRLLWDGLSNLT